MEIDYGYSLKGPEDVELSTTDPSTGETFYALLSEPLFLDYYRIIREHGLEYAQRLALGGLAINGHNVTENDRGRARAMLSALHAAATQFYGDKEEALLEMSYDRLRARKETYEEAAKVAESILRKPFTPDAWRRKIARWAERTGRPRVGLRERHKQ